MNRPGGHGRITKLHYSGDGQIEAMDVKYTLSGTDKNLEPYLVEPWQETDRTNRRGATMTTTNDPIGADTTAATPAVPGPPARRKEGGGRAASAAVDEKENSNRQPSRRNHHHHAQPQQQQQQQQRRRPSIKPLASLKRPKKVPAPPQQQAASPQSAIAERTTATTVPLVIFADNDEQSVVSELGMWCSGPEEPPSPRLSYLTDSSGSGHKRAEGTGAATNHHRGRLHSLETSDASEFTHRSSPCSKAKSIVSGQLSVVGRGRGGGGGGRGAIQSPAAGAASSSRHRKVEKRLLATSPSTTRCLAVGQVSSSPLGADEEEAAAAAGDSRDDHKRSPSQSPRKRRPTSASKLYVSQLQPVNELACCDDRFQGRTDRRDDVEDGKCRDRRPGQAPDVPDESPLDETMSCTSHDDGRRGEFISHLVDLLADHDGVLDEGCVLDMVNRRAAAAAALEAPFTAQSLDGSLRHLADQNKIMRSEGHIYLV
jgi:hypothetical protein